MLLVWGLTGLGTALGRPQPDAGASPTSEPGRTESPAETPDAEASGEPLPSAPLPGGPDSQASPVNCAAATIEVRDADELGAALEGAAPGDVIVLSPGTYVGEFVATASGTACPSE